MPPAFYATYGDRGPTVDLYGLTGAIGWFASGDFEEWEELDPALQPRAIGWRTGLATYLTAQLT
ncbi:hypothetical protein HPO96_31270 [Kribbella sandramycini]|uniref:Uncharacterized protein n=1 Tax=Kribbella sandramycini TaxID=60450 RepID=A0A7Y4L5H7_9ACTN|nr:hypothetical protein [Kribbella sandramycini]MBB6567018.1 hypothetical protein [Kribbella sandramycini]NOL44740.1 hypothetical protein [Kribbella sandramycini]